MGQGYWVIRTYEAGGIGEKTKFWVEGKRPAKSSRREKTEIRKQEQNEYSALKRFARLINENYVPGDLIVGLDYSDEGIAPILAAAENIADEEEAWNTSRAAATHAMRLYLRRIKRACDKDGVEFKYLAITSDMDSDTGEVVRLHHHLIMPSYCLKYLEERWPAGTVNVEPMKVQDDYLQIAEYFLKQVRRVPDEKKYISSRNLIRPQPKDRIAINDSELRLPKGAKLLNRGEYKPGKPQYIRYIMQDKRFEHQNHILLNRPAAEPKLQI